MRVQQDVRQTTSIQESSVMESEPTSELLSEPSLAFASILFAMMKLVSAACFWFDAMLESESDNETEPATA